ncbi:hypothetical protein [Streptomyces sp. NPDC058294]
MASWSRREFDDTAQAGPTAASAWRGGRPGGERQGQGAPRAVSDRPH